MAAHNVPPARRSFFEALCDIAADRPLRSVEWRLACWYLKDWQLAYVRRLA